MGTCFRSAHFVFIPSPPPVPHANALAGSFGGNTEANQEVISAYVSDVLNIRTEDEVLKVTVYDISGKSINTQFNNNQINVSDFTNGMYIINIVTDKANYVQKFIKK